MAPGWRSPLRTSNPSLVVALLGALLLAASPSAATRLVDQDRLVVAHTFINVAEVWQDDHTAGRESARPGDWVEAAVSGEQLGDLARANALSVHESQLASNLPGRVLHFEGGGSAGVSFDVFDPGYPSIAMGSADSAAEIFFDVERMVPFVLSVSLLADVVELRTMSGGETSVGEANAQFSLVGANRGMVAELSILDLLDDDVSMRDETDLIGMLMPDTYWFQISASVFGEGTGNGGGDVVAGYGFDLRIVPEPGAAILLLLGLVGTALHARHHGRRG